MDDLQYRIAVLGGGAVLVGVLTALRFCGDVSIPPKSAAPTVKQQPVRDLLVQASQTEESYKTYLEQDALKAGVNTPSLKDIGRKLPYRFDETKRTLAPGEPAIEVAGLKISAEITRLGEQAVLALVVQNPGDVDVAYLINTKPSIAPQLCHARNIAPFDGMVVKAHSTERRSECVVMDGIKLTIERVEVIELGGLMSWYVSRVPPAAVGVDARLIKGHKPGVGQTPACNVLMSQAIRTGLERGDVSWRDLIDFYARHRCDTYQFSNGYEYFKKDSERRLPAS